jgi:hypothetical protein
MGRDNQSGTIIPVAVSFAIGMIACVVLTARGLSVSVAVALRKIFRGITTRKLR